FRVSAVDVLVDVKLLDYAKTKYGARKAGLMLVNNPWGESNEKGLVEAVKSAGGMEIVGTEKFENSDVDMVPQLTRLKDKGADGDAIRTALEDLKRGYEGLIKTYSKPFSAENHDALTPNDYVMVHYEGDSVVPVY